MPYGVEASIPGRRLSELRRRLKQLRSVMRVCDAFKSPVRAAHGAAAVTRDHSREKVDRAGEGGVEMKHLGNRTRPAVGPTQRERGGLSLCVR